MDYIFKITLRFSNFILVVQPLFQNLRNPVCEAQEDRTALVEVVTMGWGAALHISVQIFGGHFFSFLLGMYLGVELLGHMVTLCLTF